MSLQDVTQWEREARLTFLAGPSTTALILPGVRALLMSPFKGPHLTGQLGHFSRTLGVTFTLSEVKDERSLLTLHSHV